MSDINYKCTIVKIDNLIKHPNADKLQITQIFGNTVIVGLDTKIGDLGIFFPLEAKIGAEFLKANSLYRDKTLNKDESHAGFFESNGRVSAMKLRGIPSMGYWCELEYLERLNLPWPVQEGESFNELGGIALSTKYVPKVKINPNTNMQSRKKHDRFIKNQFKEHFETEHLFKNLSRIKPEDQLVITWKLHGTSFRAGNVLVKKQFSWLSRFCLNILQIIGVPVQYTEYAYLYGTRKVIKDVNNKEQSHWYDSDLWTSVGKSNFEGKLHQGEVVYGEIVGYVPGSRAMIQKGFSYGCKEGQCEVYIYRITNTNSGGVSIDLSWQAVKDRANELGIKYVPEADPNVFFQTSTWKFEDLENTLYTHVEGRVESPTKNSHINEYTVAGIKKFWLETDCHLDSSHPEEGICIRVEGLNPTIFKAKSFRFLEYETKQLDSEEVDMESSQS
mgnify:FL=1